MFGQVYHNSQTSQSLSETERVRVSRTSNGHQPAPAGQRFRRRNTDIWQRQPSRDRRPRTSSNFEWSDQATWSILFLSLLRFRIFTQEKLSICLPLQVYRKNIFVKALLTVMLSIEKNLVLIFNTTIKYLHKIFYFSKIQLQYYSQHFLFDWYLMRKGQQYL